MSYADFLATKERRHHGDGPIIEAADLHPSLYPFQAAITRWAIAKGRCAIFADCGLGKSRMQLEWARIIADRSLILAPLSVARQTVREGQEIGMDVRYVRSAEQVDGPGVFITNYEMAERFSPDDFGAIVLDESSILKNVDGKTRQRLTDLFGGVKYRLACTATPAPNDVAEMCNHSEFLGVMPRVEMLASFFIHDDVGWRLKGHATEAMYRWMATWAAALRKPSDLGFDDTGYELPPLDIIPETVDVAMEADEGSLFPTLGGVGKRTKVRRVTMDARIARAVELANGDGEQWIVWCGLNDEASGAAAAIDGAVNVPGSWKPEQKAEALEAFQDGQIRVLVTKPRIAGFGMNFQGASRMIFLGLGDSYESYYQAIRRCYRFGQTEPVRAHIIVSELEQQIVNNVRRKEIDAARTTDQLVRYIHLDIEGSR